MKGDLKKLQGGWKIVSLEMDGQKMGGGAEIHVQGTRFTTKAMGAEYAGTLVLDEGKSPRHFDLQFEEGPEKGNTSLGIYEWDGDAWKICLTSRGGPRPAEFAAPAGTGIALELLQRVGAAVAAAASSSATVKAAVTVSLGEGAAELAGEWVPTLLVRDGEALPDAMLAHGTRTATAEQVTVRFGGRVIVKAQYGVDRSSSPMRMDYALADGGSQKGIWKFEGGELTTCFGAPGAERPADFASLPGAGRTLAVWVKKGK